VLWVSHSCEFPRSNSLGLTPKKLTGPEESRTPYPLLAKQTLYQMSYRPTFILNETGP
jgi:hypothetical protein